MAAAPVILVTGKDGQVGNALLAALRPHGTVVATSRVECDLADPESLANAVHTARPDIIVNAAAYTAVDRAESDRELAFAVNTAAPGILAELAERSGAVLIHYSTDYVFDGTKSWPYREDDATNPLSVYGASKRDGEAAVRAALPQHLILRTSWVFGAHGANFLKTMLRLAHERDTLTVVSDQFGAPTSADLIAQTTARLVGAIIQAKTTVPYGIYHLSAGGETSWHGFAADLIARARALGMPVRVGNDAVRAIPTSAYPTPAKRPANSRLDTAKLRANFGLDLPPWQDGVRTVLETLARS